MKKKFLTLVLGISLTFSLFPAQASFDLNEIANSLKTSIFDLFKKEDKIILDNPEILKKEPEPEPSTETPAKLSFISPEKGAENITGKSPVTFLFTDSIFDLENPEIVQNRLKKQIKITPEIEGSWQILGTSGILFEPKSEWQNSTHYDITIPAELTKTEILHHFETPRITLKNVQSQELINQKPLVLNFSQEVELTEIQTMKFKPSLEFDVEYLIKEDGTKTQKDIKIIPRENWKGNTKFTLTIPKGFTSKEGDLKTKTTLTRKFRTINDFNIKETDKPKDVFARFRVRFTTAITAKELAQNLEILPKPSDEIWEAYLEKLKKEERERTSFYLPPIGKYWNPNETYEIKISGNLTDKYERTLNKNFTEKFSTKFPTTFRQVFLPKQNAVLKPATEFKPTFWYSGDITNIKVEIKEVLTQKKKYTKNYTVEKSPNKETFWEFDLKTDFPDLFDENGNWFPGKYEMDIKAEKEANILKETIEKYWRSDNWYPKEHNTQFYISEFAVGLKHFPEDKFEIKISAYPETDALPENFSYEVYKSKNYKDDFFKEPSQTFLKAQNLDTFKLPNSWNTELLVKAGDKIGFGSSQFNNGLNTNSISNNQRFYERDQVRMANFSDRPLYKPGQKVYFKSIIRKLITKGKNFPLEKANFLSKQNFTIEIRDSRWNRLDPIEVSGTNNSFDGYWEIPEDAPHGNYYLEIQSANGQNLEQIEFFVGEYRKSNFLLNGKFEEETAFYKEKAKATIQAEFAFGGALKNRPVTYNIFLEGQPHCFWRYWDWGNNCETKEKELAAGEAILDENGTFQKPVDLNFEIEPEDPVWNTLKFRATVKDGNTEENSTEISIPFFMSTEKITLESAPYYFEKNTEATIAGKITDWQDKILTDKKFTTQLYKTNPQAIHYLQKKEAEDKEAIKDDLIFEKELTSDEFGKFEITFDVPEKAGNYKIIFTSTDEKGRKTETSKTFWVPGVDNKNLQLEDENKVLPLILDKETYEVGDKVEIFMPHSEWEIIRARATLERGEILEELPVDIPSQTIQFKIEKWMVPNVYVSVLLEGKDTNNNPKIKWGIVNIPVTDTSRALDIELVPNKDNYKPGETAQFQIKTTVKGEETPAELTVIIVDETLLSLKSRAKTDLLKTFLAELPSGISVSHSTANFITQDQINAVIKKISEMELIESETVKTESFDESIDYEMADSIVAPESRGLLDRAMKRMSSTSSVKEDSIQELNVMGDMEIDEGGASATPRENFQDTAKFVGKIVTNETGDSELTFDLPDNLTTWNILVIGHTEDNNFGTTEHSVKTKLPLLISEQVPNFFQIGDQVEVGLLIRRNIPLIKEENVHVQLQLPKGFETETKTKELEINEEGRVFFPIKISAKDFDLKKDFETIKFGFSVRGETSGASDTIILERKLFPPKVQMTSAEFLRIETEKAINIKPDLTRAITSKVLVKVFLSLAEKLESFVDVTKSRNYGSTEHRFSHSTAQLVQKEFDNRLGRKSGDINTQNLNENRTYIEKSFVNGGGFAFWKNAERANFWVTTQILEFADLWQTFDAEIDTQKIKLSQKWLDKQLLKKCDWKRFDRTCVSDSTRQNAGYVLAQSNFISSKELNDLSKYTHSLESKVWWLKTARVLNAQNIPLLESDKKRITDFWTIIESHMKARDRYILWEESTDYWSFYTQNERLTSLIFEEVLHENRLPNYQHKIARYLSESKIDKLSGNSALRLLQTLGQYAETKEAQNLGAEYVINTKNETELKKGYLENLDSEFELEKDITGDETFTGLQFATKNEKPFYADIQLQETFPANLVSSVSRGFWLDRKIYALEDEKMETPLTDLELGKNYVVRLKIVTNTSHRQIMLEDKIPSGAEFVNFEFENVNKNLEKYASNNDNEDNNYRCWGWCRPTFEHQEFHAEKARYFADYVSSGTYEVKYVIKTRLAGKFEVLPAQVEEMYYPEVFATTKGDSIVIK